MSDSELLARLGDAGRGTDHRDEEVIYDYLPCFGWLRGARDSAPMLELRKKTGNILAISYSWVEQIEFDPSEGVFLDVGDQRIAIRGRHLNTEIRPGIKLFEGLTRHRVPWIREVSSAELLQVPDDVCVVESINW